MGERGPAPRPAKLKLLHGVSPGRDSGGRRVRPPPAFERATPDPPDWLDLDEIAVEEWRRIVDEYAPLGLLRNVDRSALIAYVTCHSRYIDAVQKLRTLGSVVTNPKTGMVHASPYAGIADQASRELRAWAKELGLTPSAEARLQAAAPDEGDESNPFAFPG